jgi:hypothetical protein
MLLSLKNQKTSVPKVLYFGAEKIDEIHPLAHLLLRQVDDKFV